MFDASQTIPAGTSISTTLSRQFVFTEIPGQGDTRLQIANPNSRPANVTFQLVESNGMPLAIAARTIDPLGAMSEAMASLFPGITPEACNYVQAVSDVGVVPLEMLEETSQDDAGLNGIDVASGATTLYAPQYAVGGPYRSTLSIANLGDMDGKLTLRMFGADGGQIGPTRIMPIAGNGKVYIDDPSFFGYAADNPVQGYLVIKSNGPKVAGNVLISDADDGSRTALPLVTSLENYLVFSQVISNETFFADLSLLNPNNVPAIATIDLYQSDGQRDASVTLTIPARQRISGLLTDLFPGLTTENWNSGYIRVTANAGVAGFSMFGKK
jgi:hypothetical protein